MKNNQFEKGDILYYGEYLEKELAGIFLPQIMDLQRITVIDIDTNFGIQRSVLRNENTGKVWFAGTEYSIAYGFFISEPDAINYAAKNINSIITQLETKLDIKLKKIDNNIQMSVNEINAFLSELTLRLKS
jgi:hypothetical protein